MRKVIVGIVVKADFFLSLLIYPAALLLKNIRRLGVDRLPFCKRVLFNVGVFPIRAHYFEPFFDARELTRPLSENRDLPGIDWNLEEQLQILNSFSFNEELSDVPANKTDELVFYMNNPSFGSGDAEYWYNLIRIKKPNRIIEVGSGNSTLMAVKAIRKNKEETPGYECKHVCIEPYENPWLEKLGINVIRQKVEYVGKDLFYELGENDILFIDSSHVIRPQGDVLFEYLELLPSLALGVIVHIHDIFSPKDYLEKWIKEQVLFCNEQYLLEAFLTSNKDWKIIGALNFLHHNNYEKLKEKCPFLTPEREPGSFYIRKIA